MAEEKSQQETIDDGKPESVVQESADTQPEEAPGAGVGEETGAVPEDAPVETVAEETRAEEAVSIAAEELERLHAELEQARDTALRAQAEAQNAKRRAEQETEKARKFALERFSSELLPVVDNLERALESASVDDEALKPIAEGVELTLKSLVDALRKFNIEAVDPHGEPFDPNLHQAMSLVENPDVDANSVLAVMQKGYTLNGRLLRPAMVMVSKAPSA